VELTGDALVRYAARVLGNMADAEDVVQESYVKAHRALTSGRFDGRASLKTWLYRIVTRTAIDHKRSQRRGERLAASDTGLEVGFDGGAQAESYVALHELEEWLATLPLEQRSALVLQSLEGFTNGEIAGILECSEGAVEQRLVRARASLRGRERV
jgi:RNA polymerase sigma-70 factor (ECF subfamily)